MSELLTKDKFDALVKALEVEPSEFMRFMGLTYSNAPPWTVVFDATMAMDLINQLHMLIQEVKADMREQVFGELRHHIIKGGTFGSLLRVALLYPKQR